MFIDEENNYVILTPKTEIIEIEDVVPPTPAKPIPVIPQETAKLPKPIPKTLTIFQQFMILIKLLVQISLIMSMETLTLTLLNKHLTMTMT